MRTEYAGRVDEKFIGQSVTLFGWVHRRRDHGGVIFIDLRDREGLLQVVCDPDRAEVFANAEKVRNEFCLKIIGQVRRRPEGTLNESIVSGAVEVLATELVILNPSVPVPFQLDDDNLSETTRLTHRVLDLRRVPMQKNLMLRYRVAMAVRKYLDAHGFVDIETPMLTKSTPEGARDYLVPSRVHAGEFFALPQSPQLFKQLLMVAGFDRYYQIVKCFRDEDLRADRQPEFTQIDVETSFLDENEIRAIMEEMIRTVFAEVLNVTLPQAVPGDDLRRGDAPVRLRQAGSARHAAAHGRHGPRARRRVQGLQGRGRAGGRQGRRAADSGGAATRCRDRRSTPTPSSSRSTAPRALPTSRSTRRRRAATACRARSSRTCTMRRSTRCSNEPVRRTAT